MKIQPAARQHQTGIALIIVMVTITVLSILVAAFAYSMKVETKLAQNANSETELTRLGWSGVQRAREILALQLTVQNEPYDALNQVWAGGPGGAGTTNSPLEGYSLNFTLPNGSFTLKITDLERKFNINTVDERMLEQALRVVGADPGDFTMIVNSIMDWKDPNPAPNVTRMNGAKSDYYQSLDPPYFAKNGPFDDLSELLLVKGVTPEIYWGYASTNHTPAAFQARRDSLGRQTAPPSYPVGLVNLFTPISMGKVNLNTASAEVLQVIPGLDSTMADAIVAGRQGEDDGSGLLGPYRSVQDVLRVPEVNRALLPLFQQFCSVRSFTFEVQVDAEVAGYHRVFTAILGRNNGRDLPMLSFYWKE